MITEPTTSPPPTAISDLETRVQTRKQELIAKLVALKASTQSDAVETSEKIKARLSELGHLVKLGVVDGWANIGDATRTKLDHWLAQ